MRTGRALSALAAIAIVGGASLAAAPAASADQTWHQGTSRASADSPCPVTSPAEAADGWSEWQASWEQWANDGAGGYVCSRSNTWLYESTDEAAKAYPGGGCVKIQNLYVDFKGGWSLPAKSTFYTEDCKTKKGASTYQLVYAPAGWDAKELCIEAFGAAPRVTQTAAGQGAYWCNNPK